jgi:hypothetical protein
MYLKQHILLQIHIKLTGYTTLLQHITHKAHVVWKLETQMPHKNNSHVTHLTTIYNSQEIITTQLTGHTPFYNTMHRSRTLLTALSSDSGSLTLKHSRNTLASWYASGRTLSYAPVPGTVMKQCTTQECRDS